MSSTLSVQSLIEDLKAKRDSIPFVPDMEADDLKVTEGDILPITADVYDYRLDLLPPRWLDCNAFAYGEGGNPLHYFWQNGPDDYYALFMTDAETDEFYNLIGRSRY